MLHLLMSLNFKEDFGLHRTLRGMGLGIIGRVLYS